MYSKLLFLLILIFSQFIMGHKNIEKKYFNGTEPKYISQRISCFYLSYSKCNHYFISCLFHIFILLSLANHSLPSFPSCIKLPHCQWIDLSNNRNLIIVLYWLQTFNGLTLLIECNTNAITAHNSHLTSHLPGHLPFFSFYHMYYDQSSISMVIYGGAFSFMYFSLL